MADTALISNPRPRREPRVLRPHQVKGRDAAARHLRRPGTRGLFVSATGTGKTLVAIRLVDLLGLRLVLVVVPTLDLATQTALAWRADGHHEHMVIVSSMDAHGHDQLYANRVGSTSNAAALAAAMSVVGPGKDQLPALTVISTYDSLDKIEAACQHTGLAVPPFELAIMDEAHRVAGRPDKKWAVVNDAIRIRAERRLYMTATPRSFAAPDLAGSANLRTPRTSRRDTDVDVDAFANSMENEAVYGKKIFDYPLAQAVADEVAADYRIVVPTVIDTNLRATLNLPAPGTTDGSAPGGDEALRTTALHLAVLKTMAAHSLRRVLVFFHRVEDARRFTAELGHTLRLLRRTDPDAFPGLNPQTFFVDGDHSPDQRAKIFADFAAASCAILANAKVIAEGVDIPSVDAVVFADPTSSIIRCVQGLGRALRIDVSGKTALLIVPVYVQPGADPEDILGTAYEPVWAITTALASHDHRILERLPNKANRLPTETSRIIAHRWHFDFTVHPERIARAMDLIAFNPCGPVSRSRREGLTAAQAFHDAYGHLDVPADHLDSVGFELGRFITAMRDAHNAGRLDPDFTAELEALGMIWDKHQAAWRARLAAATDYHRAHGHLAAPSTTPLGAFLAEQRSLATHDRLDESRAADLTAIDAYWQLPYGADWHRKYHLLRAHLTAGNDPATLTTDTTLGGVKIGSWLGRQLTQWNHLDPGQHHLLTTLGLTPTTNPLTPPRRTRRTFAQTVQLLELFVHREGRAPTAREMITVDDEKVQIGPWLAKVRTKKRAGQLPAEHDSLLATLFEGDWVNDTAQPVALA
ncbi:DEAD/DEAH box helicase [Streptomyces poriferorum]|uniref:Helicase associated domain protein n=1 Tax=Streptomyces poriferorum TaxID=2798799 RepID=A0ABY9IFJ4_9ACTN|nr:MULTISPECIES: DEAD/DEAH box helicase [unclassified Streptomyces]MDP5315582.1 Helicase associated domain protein [Streptomyces sp. Alt4]WLQ53958.1 Helicase associated domain protein [Streptomyces sp. Alt2]